MKWIIALIAVALAASPLGLRAASSSTDATFVQTAKADFLGYYAIAGLASKKATNPHIKSLAAELASHSQQANTFVTKYAKSHALRLNNAPSTRTDLQYGDMQSLSGKQFDKKFAQDVYVDTQLNLGDFQDEAKNGDDATLRDFAKRQVMLLSKMSDAAQKAAGA